MKQRFSALDISASISELQLKLQGLRLANVYDVSPKTFLFKFQKTEVKELLLIESGTRIHSTQYVREKQANPSAFNIKLRKHLKTRRLYRIYQLGNDRRIDLQFGEGEFAYHLIIEFFATGNIILTDKDFKILALLRIVELENQTPITVGQIYEMPSISDYEPLKEHELLEKYKAFLDKQDLQEADTDIIAANENVKGFNKKKAKKKRTFNLKTSLRTIMGTKYGPSLVDQALKISGLDPELSDLNRLMSGGDEFNALLKAFNECDKIVQECVGQPQKGYIVGQKILSTSNESNAQIAFEDFLPFKPLFVENGKEIIEFESFDKAVDEFFSKIESQRLEQKARQAELHAIKKLEAVKQNNANQILNFQISQEKKNLMAQAIEYNLDLVDSAIKTICSFVASGMDWGDLNELVKTEQDNGNPLARAIYGLKLDQGMITIQLPNPDAVTEEEESDDDIDETDSEHDSDNVDSSTPAKSKKKQEMLLIDIDIYQTAYSNARSYYVAKKVAIVKEQKTVAASVKAIENAERKIMETLQKKEKLQATITKYRPPLWFEKFLWFLSTENYMVVGGRDATQHEQLVTKYMRKEDYYVCADMENSAGILVKPLHGCPKIVPSTTLLQAGTMSVCQSRAWEAKIVTSAYWVGREQLTKVSAAGDSLPIGKFNIKGKKNYLPPVQLVYGIALLFQVDETCAETHYLERRPWARDGYEPPIQQKSIDDLIDVDKHDNFSMKNLIDMTGDIDEKEESDIVNDVEFPDENNQDEDIQGDIGSSSKIQFDSGGDQESMEQPEKKKLSAKQRRDAKKGKPVDLAPEKQSVDVAPKVSSPQTPKALPRGKKSKLKKINAKYADQDEEDREMMLELIGSNKGPQPKGKKAKQKAQDEASKEKQRLEKNVSVSEITAKKSAEKHMEPVDLQKINPEIPETNVDDWTGQPAEQDTLLAVIPVCAPWIALQKYKYKLKLLPGSLKKGKASQQVKVSFTAMAKKQFKSETEAELIDAVPDQEWINAIMGKVKIVTQK